jgi:hypothetical protein
MPLEDVRYRVKDGEDGRKVRLAFDIKTNEVVEAVAMPPKKLSAKAKAKKK